MSLTLKEEEEEGSQTSRTISNERAAVFLHHFVLVLELISCVNRYTSSLYIMSINMHCRTRQLSIYPQLVLRRRLNFIHDLIVKALDCILKPHDAISS